MKKKKILLISVSTGSGHVRAAEAVKKTANLLYPNLIIEHIDMMDYVSPAMRKSIVNTYDIMAMKIPELWGYFYKKTNSSKLIEHSDKVSNLFNQFNCSSFFKYILQYKPSHILSTHFLPAYAVRSIQKKNKLNVKISLLMTDYFAHDLQIAKNVQHYFVPTLKTKYHLLDNNIKDSQITISGIPTNPIFYTPKNLTSLRKKYGAKPDKINLLILSGGQGLIDTSSIIKTLEKLKNTYRIFAIAGKNEKLKTKLDKLKNSNKIELHTIGWSEDIDEYMRIADYIITKPGGLSTTECIILNKPVIAVSPIPGQEDCNAEYLLENNLGVVVRTPSDLLYYLDNTMYWVNKIKKPTIISASEIILKKLIEL
ncbi:MAG: glycosyltransferase [bacterium]|nr:glycosyltransferase [bacterium]